MARYYRKNSNDEGYAAIVTLAFFALIGFISQYWAIILLVFVIIGLYFLIRFIIDLDLKSNFKKPNMYYMGTNGIKWLEQLKKEDPNNYKIKTIESGLYGEKRMLHSLEYSNIPMYILYDLKLSFEEYTAQIDAVAVTKKNIYFLESKNLKDNIDIENNGSLTRRKGNHKRGLKNPITQNSEHEIVIRNIFKFEGIKANFMSWVVLTNDNSYVNYKKNNYEVKVMRNDKLIENMKKKEFTTHLKRREDGVKKICDILLKYNINEAIVHNVEPITEPQKIEKDSETIINELKDYRRKRMNLERVEAYIIFKDETINDLVLKRPTTISQLYDIKGLGEMKIQKYGNDILKIINEETMLK